MNRLIALVLLGTSACAPVVAWDGTTSEGHGIEVESYDHQGQGGGDVEYYDNETGEYKSGYMDIEPGGDGTIIDDETGEEIEVDMD